VTAGSPPLGAIGGVFAPPFLKIGLDAAARLRAAGVFSDEVAPPVVESMAPMSQWLPSAPAPEGEGW
jgi:hypothetical protein